MTLIHRCHLARRRIISTPRPPTTQPIHSILVRLQNLRVSNATPRPFSTTPALSARKKQALKKDKRITLIRYHLQHPLTPRPLRFSRNRSLRHWTIHRAYHLFLSQQRRAREAELEKQFQTMSSACEALRLIGEDGLAVSEGGKAVPPPGARDPVFVSVDTETGVLYGPEAGEAGGASKNGASKTESSRSDSGSGSATRELEHIDVRAAAERQKEVGRLYRTAMLKTGVWDGVPIEYARAQTETPPRNGWDHAWTRA